MKIKLIDYESNPKEFEVENPEGVVCAIFQELAGDEVLTLVYEDRIVSLDSCESRFQDIQDSFLVVCRNGKWDPRFMASHLIGVAQ